MKFSQDGKLFAIYDHSSKTVRIYESSNIEQCFKDIDNKNPCWEFKIENKNFDAA